MAKACGLRFTRAGLLVLTIISHQSGTQASADVETRPTGLIFMSPADYEAIPLAVPPVSGTLPSSVDLSPDFPPPGDQKDTGTCVGWAVGYALKTYQERVERGWDLSTEDTIFSPWFIYNQISMRPGDCEAGAHLKAGLDLVAAVGAATLADFPSTAGCFDIPDQRTKDLATQYRVAKIYKVDHFSSMDVKSHIAAGFPVIVALKTYENFYAYRGGIYAEVRGVEKRGHAMVVVGYDDGVGAFKLMNSWGRGWGEDGFIWISYELFSTLVRESYATHDIIVRRDIPAVKKPTKPVPTKSVVPQIEPQPKVSDVEDVGSACDRLAADPHDVRQSSPGVPELRIDTVAAIKACSAALDQYPNTFRFAHQLYRVVTDPAAQEFKDLWDSLQPKLISLMQKAADAGYPAAMREVAWAGLTWGGKPLYFDEENRFDVAQDFRPLEEAAMRAGDLPAQFWFAYHWLTLGEEWSERRRLMQEAAEGGVAIAQRYMYEDFTRDVTWLEQAALNGEDMSFHILFNPKVVPDPAKRAYWYRKYIEFWPKTFEHMGLAGQLESGEFVEIFEGEYISLLEYAARMATTETEDWFGRRIACRAAYKLGQAYELGILATIEKEKAKYWYRETLKYEGKDNECYQDSKKRLQVLE